MASSNLAGLNQSTSLATGDLTVVQEANAATLKKSTVESLYFGQFESACCTITFANSGGNNTVSIDTTGSLTNVGFASVVIDSDSVDLTLDRTATRVGSCILNLGANLVGSYLAGVTLTTSTVVISITDISGTPVNPLTEAGLVGESIQVLSVNYPG